MALRLCIISLLVCFRAFALDATNWVGGWVFHGSHITWVSGGTFSGVATDNTLHILQFGTNSYTIDALGLDTTMLTDAGGALETRVETWDGNNELATRFLRVLWITNDLIVVTDITSNCRTSWN